MDNAWQMRNRDSSCTVYLWDIDSYGNWYVIDNQAKQASAYKSIPHDRNNGHSRCYSDQAHRPANA